MVQRSRRMLEARLGAERWKLWLHDANAMGYARYIVTVNLRNQVHEIQHPELAICLRWAYLLVCECKGVNKGGTARVYYSLSSLDYKRRQAFLVSGKAECGSFKANTKNPNIEIKRDEQSSRT